MAVERLLLETGDYLLLESGGGDKLLLESSTAGGTAHATTGALTGAGAVIAGTAARVAGAVTHETSGALVGSGSLLDGTANGPAVLTTAGGGGWLPKMRRKTRKELHADRVRLGILPPDIVKAAEKVAAKAAEQGDPVEEYQDNKAKLDKVFLEELGATKLLPDYQRAIYAAIRVMQDEEDNLVSMFF